MAKFLKGKNLIGLIIAVVLIFLIIFVGRYFGASWVVQVVIILFFLLIGALFFMFKKMKDAQKAGKIEDSINSSADDQMANLSPEKKAEIEQFKKQLQAAIASLKNSKLAKGKSGRAALYALPWYMIIGPSAAGKTTAIQNSGLDFPFGKEGFRGVGGTRNCDWFFSTKAIFLDTAGRYVTQSEDKAEWMAFLETLRKNRSRKPINGVIVALNIDEIINNDKDQMYEHARNIRQRIDELIEKLGVNFPVYFMFTKCDLIQGFVEYFGDFSEIERGQIWGSTFSPMHDFDAKTAFENEFNVLANKLFDIRTIRLSSPLKREQRRKVFLFPYQFKTLQSKLTSLIGEVFQNNPYQDNPIFRGFYFSSGTQEGLPLDLAIREIAKQFNLAPASSDEFEERTETKNYFIKDLLSDLVIGDQNYAVGKTSGVVKQHSTMRTVTIAASAVLLVLLSLFAFMGYNGSSIVLDNISSRVSSFNKINWSGNLLSNFKEAEELRILIEKIEDGSANEAFITMGLDRSEETLQSLKQLYLKKTEPFFTQNIYDDMVRNLNHYANGQDYSGEETYNYLKAYLLLGSERARLDTSNQKFLVNVFTGILDSRFIKSNPAATTEIKDSLKSMFRNYLAFFANNLSDKNFYNIKNDNLLVNLVRSRMQYQPNAEGIYARLKQNGMSEFPNEFTLEQAIGGIYSNILTTDMRVPYIFTADGWINYIKDAILEESTNPGKEDWALGKQQIKPATGSEMTPDEMKRNLLNLYLNDYQQTWVQFLQSLRYGDFGSGPVAATNLKLLSDPISSPLVLITKIFADQLQVISEIYSPTDTLRANPFAGLQLNATNAAEVMKYKKFVLGAPDGSKPGEINAIIVQYGVISGVLESIRGGQDLSKDYAVNVLSQRAVEFPTALQMIKGALYNIPALQPLFIDPIRLSWRAILSDASQYLNAQWKSKVHEFYSRTLANSFPFKQNGPDAPIQDFKDFFKPDGILWSFFNEELSSLINKERWKANAWENEGVGFSGEFINTLKRADDITSTLFKSGDLSVSFRLKPQLPDSKPIRGQKPIVEQVYLNINGNEDYYKMGSPFWTDYNWPGGRGAPVARMNISIRDYGTSETKGFDGEWALFKLLQDASSMQGQSAQYNVNWSFKKENVYDVTVTYQLTAGSSKNPFTSGFFRALTIPASIN
ncbi:MAG: type VI secretion system membrane subunit TssM [Ignavibacteriales bacterium]|nr:MAG: type VI secretion system membrane subunit TssM [Ignavibacteriales bacterium]